MVCFSHHRAPPPPPHGCSQYSIINFLRQSCADTQAVKTCAVPCVCVYCLAMSTIFLKNVLFFQGAARDAVTLLNIIYNHVLPDTTIYSDCWASYNQIVNLDRRYNHRTVNHSLTFVAPDGTHTNNIESTWKAVKRQFKDMNRLL